MERFLSNSEQCFDKTIYKPFKQFLPGHRASLLAMPNLVEEYELQTKMQQSEKHIKEDDPQLTFIMEELIKTAKNNANKKLTHRRYPQSLQNFGMFLYMMCGKASYEIICNNIPLPQASTMLGYINKKKQRIVEGGLRCSELASFLDKVGAPRVVWLAEDGSGIVSKVSYDSSTNQLVGLVLPFHSETGIPIPFTYKPKSVRDLEEFLKHPKSTHVYIIMAQPIKANTPPFILEIFGTDNKFQAITVVRRWNHTIRELEK